LSGESSGFLDRWLRRSASSEPGTTSKPQHAVSLPVKQATVGLCFNYERGLDFREVYHADAGLEHVLAVLDRRGLRATFNSPAKLCETAPDRLRLIHDRGHEICVLGHADESPCELTDDAVRQLVFSCRAAFDRLGLRPVGFRAPRSQWDMRLCAVAADLGFRYSAEHDHAKHPYVLIRGTPPLVRLPVCTDDRGLRHGEETRNLTISKMHRYLRKAATRGHYVSILFHPWILMEERERMDVWEEWLETAVRFKAKIGAMQDVLPDVLPADVQE